MKVIIPVAGAGTRLHPHTLETPKPLLITGNKPVIDHIIAPLLPLDPDEFRFVVGYKGEMIQSHLRARYQFPMAFLEQDELHGLGYAIFLALRDMAPGPVMIILGDTIIDCDFGAFAAAGEFVLGVREVPDPHRFGIAEISNGKIVGLEEKPKTPKSRNAVIGLYYFADSRPVRQELEAVVTAGVRTRGEIQLTDALQMLIEKGMPCTPFPVSGWYDCGTREKLIETSAHLLSQLPPPRVRSGSALHAPVYLADSATVEHSVIGPNVSIMDRAIIKHSIISDSIISPDAIIERMVIHHSLVGPGAIVRGELQTLDIGARATFEPAS